MIVFVALLYGAYYFVGGSLFGKKTKVYYADFQDAGGVLEGTQVLMAGVQVGTVKKVALRTAHEARMTLELHDDIMVPQGSTAVLPSSLLSLGTSPVSIVPPEGSAPPLEPGSVLQGNRPNPLDAILPDSKDTIKELTLTLRATRKLMENGKLMDQFQALMKTSNDTISKFGLVAQQTQSIMASNRVEIDRAIHSASLAMQDVQTSTAMVAKLLKDGKLQGQSLALLKSLNATADKASGLVTDIDKFVNDPKLRDPMATSMANVSDMTHTGTKIAKNAEEITANGAIVSKKAIELADKAGLIEDEAREVLKKLGGFFNKPGSKSTPIKIGMDLTRQSKPAYWRTDITAQTTMADGTFNLGIYDAFESNKIIAQLGKPFSSNGDLRYGVYASKPGIGVDYRLTPKLGLRGDLFDINDPRLNLRMQYELRDSVYGWIGMDRIFRQNAPSIGIGVRK